MSEKTGVGGLTVGNAGVETERSGPGDSDVDPIQVQDAVGGGGVGFPIGESIGFVFAKRIYGSTT